LMHPKNTNLNALFYSDKDLQTISAEP